MAEVRELSDKQQCVPGSYVLVSVVGDPLGLTLRVHDLAKGSNAYEDSNTALLLSDHFLSLTTFLSDLIPQLLYSQQRMQSCFEGDP